MLTVLKRFVSLLPESARSSLKRVRYAKQIRAGDFEADEPEVRILPQLVKRGDWVLDVGANVGHYTLALSQLVGDSGRVIALEPIRSTFAFLASNVDYVGANNVTLFNVAATGSTVELRMDMPKSISTGMANPYQAQVSANGQYAVLGVSLDSLLAGRAISLAKIDAEGHELEVLKGMRHILTVHRPILIVEGVDQDVEALLREHGYKYRALAGSPNRIYEHVSTSSS